MNTIRFLLALSALALGARALPAQTVPAPATHSKPAAVILG